MFIWHYVINARLLQFLTVTLKLFFETSRLSSVETCTQVTTTITQTNEF
jgi:hypothetical protein